MPVREARKKRCKDRKLAAESRRQMEERTQCQNGCRGRLVIAHRGMSHHATVAQQKQKRSDTRMSRHATVARSKGYIVKENLTQGDGGSLRK
jgi:hypothetical protein